MWWALIILGCRGTANPQQDDTGATTDDCADDWWSTGEPLMLSYCAGCHSSHLTGDARYGATDGVNLETLEGALLYADRIRARTIEAGDMPPGGGMSADELARLEAWLACASQQDHALPSLDITLPDGRWLDFTVSVEDRDGWTVLSRADFEGEPLMEEYYVIQGEDAWFGGYTTFDDSLPGGARTVLLEPSLLMTDDDGSWSETVSVTVEEGGTATTDEESWTIQSGDASRLDGRAVDRTPTEVVMIAASGELHAWHLSETHILSGRWIEAESLFLQAYRQDHYSPDVETEVVPFPFANGDVWQEGAILLEGETW